MTVASTSVFYSISARTAGSGFFRVSVPALTIAAPLPQIRFNFLLPPLDQPIPRDGGRGGGLLYAVM